MSWLELQFVAEGFAVLPSESNPYRFGVLVDYDDPEYHAKCKRILALAIRDGFIAERDNIPYQFPNSSNLYALTLVYKQSIGLNLSI